MKEYIRSTHYFDNKSREWIYRGDRGMDKYIEWNDPKLCLKVETKMYKYSLGVHALKDHQWMSLDWIVEETIKMFLGDAAGNTAEFKNFIDTTPDYRWIIRNDILKELIYLVSVGMVQEREV